ncbi:hypothetical protein HGH93_07740 [Chitinophaga polysaccharea]|uniref:Uncharacterized protein n=1 Tax=Chitinophaga eiseniae TaxID=634771 RepID=A0A847SNQ0_9BACT|nr:MULTISPECIES: hypothetical protein [Chitinophaga]NLR57988.1 hypothetical protein [Chitinophaga polysaccharea]NLR77612.1 hypothetical protein [Chitinophaga eiseniae]NLU93581.1 hypothetical protein [Chitinophaga sp. Ak27]
MSNLPNRPIPSDAGGFISLEEMLELTKNHDDDHANQKSFDSHVKAMCFGKDKVLELLDQPGAVALRIYYGIKLNGDSQRERKMILVAVDENGNDILPKSAAEMAAAQASGIVAKDTPPVILDQGVPCPQYCSGTKP